MSQPRLIAEMEASYQSMPSGAIPVQAQYYQYPNPAYAFVDFVQGVYYYSDANNQVLSAISEEEAQSFFHDLRINPYVFMVRTAENQEEYFAVNGEIIRNFFETHYNPVYIGRYVEQYGKYYDAAEHESPEADASKQAQYSYQPQHQMQQQQLQQQYVAVPTEQAVTSAPAPQPEPEPKPKASKKFCC